MLRRSGEQQVFEKSGRRDKDGSMLVCDGLGTKRIMMRGRWLVAPSDCKHTKPGFCPSSSSMRLSELCSNNESRRQFDSQDRAVKRLFPTV
jgi:hypothetical protein